MRKTIIITLEIVVAIIIVAFLVSEVKKILI
jgi:hypothetical protein